MRNSARVFFSLAALVLFAPGLSAQLVLTEFMADNLETLLDADGEPSDWIEVYNGGSAVVSLAGWSLTDDATDPGRWVFPALELGAGEFLLVFASGKDRRDTNGELHTNFRLSRQGEYLGLLSPDGSVASHFAPEYPEQLSDRSYGRSMELDRRVLREAGAEVSYLVPPDDALGLTWIEPVFDAGEWATGDLPIGFDNKDEPTFGVSVRTNLGDVMNRQTASLFLRAEFPADASDLERFVELRLAYNDGFILHINGVEVASDNVFRSRIIRNTRGIFARRDALATVFERVPFFGAEEFLQVGQNVIGLHALNHSNRSPDLFFDFAVEALEVMSVGAEGSGYFGNPTPQWPNEMSRPGLAVPPVATPAGGTYQGPVTVALTSPTSDSEIRYTLDGSEPDSHDPLYTGPIVLDATAVLRTRTFRADLLASRTSAETYIVLAPDLAEFSSDLPIVVVSTFGAQLLNDAPRSGHFAVIDPAASDDGRSRFLDPAQFRGDASIKVRGSSTSRRTKGSYSVEIQDDRGVDRDVQILDLPKESDFVLYGAFEFDRALMRNAFMYELSNDVGRYASRTRFCEVFLNRTDGPLSSAHYMGVYSIIEKLKRGKDRVDVARLGPEDTTEPDISGGYIFKVDRLDPGDSGFSAGGQGFGHVDPKEEDITGEQKEWLVGNIDAFAAALNGPDFADPETGYPRFIDVGAWIDHHILNEFSKNPDGLRLSTYFHKDREGKIAAGPIWDFDRALGPDADDRAADPVGFSSLFVAHFWGRLFEDPSFMARYQERWFELRSGAMSVSKLVGIIDRMAGEIAEAAPRNFQKWSLLPQDGWPVEVEQFATWVEQRALWIDSQFVPNPELSLGSGELPSGTMLEVATAAGEIFLTVDGTDPRALDGSLSVSAIEYEVPLTLDATTEVWTRTRLHGMFWSELVSAVYTVESEPPLPQPLQRPGDFNQDRRLNLTDAVDLLSYLQGTLPHSCAEGVGRVQHSDFNGDERLDLTDALAILNFLFQRGAPHVLGYACAELTGCPVGCE
jgi:hypothetical protein